MKHIAEYWMKGEGVQNFGDFLSELFMRDLFFPQAIPGRELRIVGSCIDDMFVPPVPLAEDGTPAQPNGPIFWGCGLRQEDGLSPGRRPNAEILAVRGPLSRSALRLGNGVPIGDPGLLLPALHRAAHLHRASGAALLMPHFHESRPDAELLRASGCDIVLRPNIPNDLTSITETIDHIVAADFVLSASLHGAIVAVAYGKPFGFWQDGHTDLPFKWADFAASIGIPVAFHNRLPEARAYYEAEIAPVLRIPVLWPLLVSAPLPVRPDAFMSVVELDVRRHGLAALDAPVSSRATNRLQDKLRELVQGAEEAERLQKVLRETVGTKEMLHARVTELGEAEGRLTFELAQRRGEIEALLQQDRQRQEEAEQHQQDAKRWQEEARQRQEALQREERLRQDAEQQRAGLVEQIAELEEQWAESNQVRDNLWNELQGAQGRQAHLAAEEARLHEAVRQRDIAHAALRAELQRTLAQQEALLRSSSWRLTRPLRAVARRLPRARSAVRRGLRIAWWAATLQLSRHLAHRRRVRQQIALLAASPLFDREYYLQRHPDVRQSGADSVAHYVHLGGAQGYEPNALFDGQWYRAHCQDPLAGGMTPLAHYLLHGGAQGMDPGPLFETEWYRASHPDAGPGAAALEHYLRQGVTEGANPNRLFHAAGYMYDYADARASGLDAVSHYLLHGAALGHDPHPFFDTDWYLAQYPEVAASGRNPLAYYLGTGAAMGHRCTPLQRDLQGFALDRPLIFEQRHDPEVSIVIPTYGHYFETLRCLHALQLHSGGWVGYEVIVMDDKPAAPLGPFLAGIPGLRVEQNPTNLGFLRSCNRAAQLSRGWHIVFLNNDTLVRPDWLEPMLRLVRQDPLVGLVGCKLLNADGTIQEAGGIIQRDGWGYAFGRNDDPAKPEYNYLRPVDVVIGAAFMVRKESFDALGGFDDRYAPAFYEEFDLAFEMHKAGLKVLYQPESEVVHLGSASYGAEQRDRQSLKNHAKFCEKWAEELKAQPMRGADLFLARQRPEDLGIILMIDDKVPEYDRHAGALTIFQYVRLIRNLGFRVVYAPADMVPRQPYTTTLQRMGVEVLYAPVRLEEWLRANGRQLTAIWTARPYVTAPMLPMLRRHSKARILYYPHDLHYLREQRRYELEGDPAALEESNRVKKLELAIFRGVDCVMTPSAEEARIIARQAPRAQVRVVPPYLYPPESAHHLAAAEFTQRTDIMFVGGFNHPPNTDAALLLVREVMPLVWREMPEAHVTIVGDNPTPEIQALGGPRVEVTGYVPRLEPYFDRARISASPLRYGAGVKGKIVSSLQAGIPVVTTAIGNEGIALRDGEEVLLGETPEALAAAILRLMRDDELCARLSSAGAAVIRERFSEALARQVMAEVLEMQACRVCGKVTLGGRRAMDAGQVSPCRAFTCDVCHAPAASQALAEVLIAAYRNKGKNSIKAALPLFGRLRIHAFGCTGPIVEQMQDLPLFSCSEYIDDVAPGEYAEDGALCLDPRHLTFRDNELDLLIGQHAFKDLPDAEIAFREAHRVLKVGGRHVFTASGSKHLVEAALQETTDELRHVLPLREHDDPPGGQEAVAVRDVAQELTALLERIGFDVVVQDTDTQGAENDVLVISATKRSPV
jgi:GT2 family glycosyltransferase/glycosyltransferase involved in cell wall biosynthesis/SAM-dependent methyltransferase